MAEVINRKEQIIEVACILFREKGYAGASMRDIAGYIGIEPASLYSHYKSKEHILQTICFGMAEDFFEAQKAVDIQTLLPHQKLEKAIEAHIRVIVDNADASAVFFHDWRYLNEPSLSTFKALRKKYESIFAEILKEGIETGVFRNMDQAFTLQTIFSSVNWLYDWQKAAMLIKPEQLSKNFCHLLFSGIKKHF